VNHINQLKLDNMILVQFQMLTEQKECYETGLVVD